MKRGVKILVGLCVIAALGVIGFFVGKDALNKPNTDNTPNAIVINIQPLDEVPDKIVEYAIKGFSEDFFERDFGFKNYQIKVLKRKECPDSV